jgi:hypothetical protein
VLQAQSVFTSAFGIDSDGAITGAYYDSSGVVHGYLRTP